MFIAYLTIINIKYNIVITSMFRRLNSLNMSTFKNIDYQRFLASEKILWTMFHHRKKWINITCKYMNDDYFERYKTYKMKTIKKWNESKGEH